MICPACRKPMLILEFNDVEIDHCTTCGGVWLDAGELDLIAQGDGPSCHLERVDEKGKSKRRCPRCNARMRVGLFPGSEIELDTCFRGHGIWFDKGELESVLKTGGTNGAAARLCEYFGSVFGSKKGDEKVPGNS